MEAAAHEHGGIRVYRVWLQKVFCRYQPKAVAV